ncbi:minor capsid protein [Streptococcus porcorum]|uniref:SPP1 gp7 family putative phage head morphogenesis protein n=1 Tax=Streptococcus porcorum TaxID=701526 RepID=A0ABV2JFA6_9STRE
MSIDYWRDRYKLEEAVRASSDAEFEAQLKAVYQQHIRDIQNEIDGFWQRYADRNGITKLEAQKQADKIDVTLVGFKAKQLVERAERLRASGKIVDASYFTKAENDLMRLYNLKMKTSRLEVLQANLKLLQYELAMSEHENTQRHLLEAVRREHLYSSGILKDTLASYKTPNINAEAIIYANFHGARWDKTIWKRQDALRSVVKKAVSDTVLRGHGTAPLIKQLEREFKVSYSYARRLAVTETARVYSEAQRLNYEANGFDEYEIIAESGACGVCAPLNGTHYKVSAMAPGYNAPPFHPNCRCTTGAYYSVDREGLNDNRKLLDIEPRSDTIKMKDIQLPHSLSAMARDIYVKSDYPVRGDYLIKRGSTITNVEVIAGKDVRRQIDDIRRLVRVHGGKAKDWQKVKGHAILSDGRKIEAHWYQAKNVGKVEFKIKRWL